MAEIKLLLSLSENWTMLDPRDLKGQVALAVEGEQAGFDGVLVSEHVVMGDGADANGLPMNPREFVMPGNQHPSTPWPSSLVLMSAVAAATTKVRIVGGAVIAPLRHPLLLAKQLATLDLLAEGRLIVLPTVSWHKAEYDALGVPFNQRGEILDELLEICRAVWSRSPVSFHGQFFNFDNIWVEPKAYRPSGPTLWFGGASLHNKLLNRLAHYGSGYLPLMGLAKTDRTRISTALQNVGRHISEFEFVGALSGRFEDANSCARLDSALGALKPQILAGARAFVVKPSQFIDHVKHFRDFAEEVVEKSQRFAQEIA